LYHNLGLESGLNFRWQYKRHFQKTEYLPKNVY